MVEGFVGFGAFDVGPEGVGEGFENDEVGLRAGGQQGAVEKHAGAEELIAGAAKDERGREAREVAEDR